MDEETQVKALLINMPIRTNARPANLPLGIYYVGRALQDAGMEVGYLDLNLLRGSDLTIPHVRSLLAGKAADVYMLSGLITTLRWQEHVCKAIRLLWPGTPIVSGGGLATNIGSTLRDWLGIDTACFGEGELLAPALLDDLFAGVPHMCYSSEKPDVDVIAEPIWDDVDGLETYIKNPIWGCDAKNSSSTPFTMKRSMNLVVSRGCPYDCKFCSKDALGGRTYRTMSPERIVDLVARLQEKYNLDFIGFTDDNLLVKRAHAEKLCKELIETGLPLKWGCHARFDECADPEFLEMLYRAGCRYIGFGGESANKGILASMRKGNDPGVMRHVLDRVRKAGIHPNVTWMMGWPGETREQVRETAQFILKYAPENRSMFVATAYPGTELWDEVKEKILAKFGTLRAYVEQLGDATKPVVNLSAIPDDEFLEVRGLIDAGELEKI